jgi:hypothetical protein
MGAERDRMIKAAQSAYELDSARRRLGKAIEHIPQRSDSGPEHGARA